MTREELAEILPIHVMRLANTNMGLSLMAWNKISNDILGAAALLSAELAKERERRLADGEGDVEEIRARHERVTDQLAARITGIVCQEGRDAHADRATLLALVDRLRAEMDGLKEQFAGPAAWLDSWAQHVGSCKGGYVCTCGLTLARTEANSALNQEPGQ